VPPDTSTAPDLTPEDGMSLDDLEDAPSPADATDPRIPERWAETVEMLLEQGRTELQRADDVPTRMTPAEGVLLLTARKAAAPAGKAPIDDDDDDIRTVAVQARQLIERVRAAGPLAPQETPTIQPPPMPELVRTVEHPQALEHARMLDARVAEPRERRPSDPGASYEERPRTGEQVRVAEQARAAEQRAGSSRIRAQVEPPAEADVPIELPLKAKATRSDPPRAEPSAVERTGDKLLPRAPEPWESVVKAPSEITQRREALRLVPDVAHVAVAAPPPSERSEDGLIPSGLLDRKLTDMAVLLRYGHEQQVRHELEQLRVRYPQDLLLARRIAEFYLTNERPVLALEQLFSLATGLFERRNVEGMRQALEQVLVIDPQNERATRLLGLLEQRPSDPTPAGRKR
ncbi:MAG: hypothetical protein K1X94_32905, partial [Sandaracinaceae bacterium]|nr:hypothetical protein [Sandaracinaceae bacterium]